MKIISQNNNEFTYQYDTFTERNNHLNSLIEKSKEFIITHIGGGNNNEPLFATFNIITSRGDENE